MGGKSRRSLKRLVPLANQRGGERHVIERAQNSSSTRRDAGFVISSAQRQMTTAEAAARATVLVAPKPLGASCSRSTTVIQSIRNPAEILRGGTVWSGYLRLDGVGRDLRLKTKNPLFPEGSVRFDWLRGRDLNPRPLGYEPNELPDCSTPRHW